jgi:hypothetical protein
VLGGGDEIGDSRSAKDSDQGAKVVKVTPQKLP